VRKRRRIQLINFFGQFFGMFLHGSEKNFLGGSRCSLTVVMGVKIMMFGLLCCWPYITDRLDIGTAAEIPIRRESRDTCPDNPSEDRGLAPYPEDPPRLDHCEMG